MAEILQYKYTTKLQDLEIISRKKKRPLTSYLFSLLLQLFSFFTMSSCGNCDCSDKTQCVKKGNSYGAVIMENENSSFDAIVMNFPAAEHNDKCSCNPCSCPNCGCNN
ncbi:hypothetical protein IC575_014919 [Cucumis melo]|uniref:Metallothionein-like protein type 3 n=2 Tax=Cucumis melo TaxID=3656 RepID=A0ABM3KY80_CUCME|nr:metallothionein-like protein type 3 [Cucumis melo]